jgi:hypothetical protein
LSGCQHGESKFKRKARFRAGFSVSGLFSSFGCHIGESKTGVAGIATPIPSLHQLPDSDKNKARLIHAAAKAQFRQP